MATVHVTTVTEFKTAIQTANNYVILDNDLDFTNEKNLSIASEVTIDGSGQTGSEKHKLSHFFLNENNSIFEAKSYNIYNYFKNCVFDDILIILNNYDVNRRYFFIGNGSYNVSYSKFTNVDLMIKYYLACPSYNTDNPYRALFVSDTWFTKCNVVIDIYYILPKDIFNFTYAGAIKLMEDSIFKFTLYDPNGWGNFNNSNLTNNITKMANSAIITEYKSDYSMIPDQNIKIVGQIQETDNCYFIFHNTGRFKLTPQINNMRVTTYVFVNSGPADPSAPRSPAQETKISWNISQPQYSGGSYQLKQLTDEDCKNRATFEDGYPAQGSSPVTNPFPFKLKQDYEP